jgi:hypothetical protein
LDEIEENAKTQQSAILVVLGKVVASGAVQVGLVFIGFFGPEIRQSLGLP